MAPQTLSDLGETALLREVFALLPVGRATLLGPGDDAAVVATPDGRVVVTTDVLVEDRDFRRRWSSAADVGWKAAVQNLADVAAMGAVPTSLLVSLAAPPSTEVEWALGLCRGLAQACGPVGVGVVGGDLSGADQIVVGVTALGDLQGREPLRRSGARPGDVVALAGRVGRSAAGLALLEAGLADLDPALVDAHRRPQPPLAAGPAAARAGATSMIDVSDGLLRDLGRLADASAVTVDLGWRAHPPDVLTRVHHAPLLPAASAFGDQATADRVAQGWVLTGGEDHALLGTFPPDAQLPDGFEVVGEVQRRLSGWPSVVLDGDDRWDGSSGWDHFGG